MNNPKSDTRAMHFSCGIVTYQAVTQGRLRLLKQTINSLLAAFPAPTPIYVLDNGSEDESPTKIRETFGANERVLMQFVRHPDGNHTPGRGRNCLLDWMMRADEDRSDVFVFSDDDMVWHADAGQKLEAIYSAPPSQRSHGSSWNEAWDEYVAIVCGLLEPDYSWATPRARIVPGGVPVLVRASVPGAAWTFRVRPNPEWRELKQRASNRADGLASLHKCSRGAPVFKEDFGYDSAMCAKLAAHQFRFVALDLADHIGRGRSTHNNEPIAKPLDRKHWGI